MLTQGIHQIPAKQYHADPAPTPSLSSSVLQILLAESPLHAWNAHPRLNPHAENDASRRAEIGSVAHKLALAAGSDVRVIEFDSYRKKEAQEQRDAALADGLIPILADDYDAAKTLAVPLREAAEQYLGAAMLDCLREQVVIWQEGGFWRRAMVDAMTKDLRRVCDLKTTQASVSPAVCARRIYDSGYHIQDAFYVRGLDAIDPDGAGRRSFGFVFAEQGKPYAVSPPIELSEAGLDMGRQQVAVGCALWDSCLKSNEWPGYSGDTYIAEPPSWKLTEWGIRMENDESLNPRQWTGEQLYGSKA